MDPWRVALVVRVKSPAEAGRANEEIAQVLAHAFGVSVAAIEIARGGRSRDKEIRVRGISAERLRAALEGAR